MPPAPPARPHPLLTKGNRRLSGVGVYVWSIPALKARVNGTTIRTCLHAGVCAASCYALAGNYLRANVRKRHLANLQYILEDAEGWEAAMIRELTSPRYRGAWVRLHDAGDFFSDAYTRAWLRIVEATPKTAFYAYTKEIRRFRRLVEPAAPANFHWIYSWGGTEDALLDDNTDRTADVFPSAERIPPDWHSQEESDLLAVLGPPRVAVVANRIPHLRKRQGDRSFREWQAEQDAQRGRNCRSRTDIALHRQPRRAPDSVMRAASPHPAPPPPAAPRPNTSASERPDPATRGGTERKETHQ